MSTKKREWGSSDTQPVALYAKIDGDSEYTYPIIINADGTLKITQGFSIPEFDEINLDYSGSDIIKVVYTLASVTQATLTLTYTDGNLTKVVKT